MHLFPWRSAAVILNRQAGSMTAGAEMIAEELRKILAEGGAEPDIRLVNPGEIAGEIRKALRSDCDAIIVAGGDGTVATAATLMAGQDKPLGILPLGTFNLAARDLGMSVDFREAARQLANPRVAETDLLEVGDRMFCCMVVLGFYPALAFREPEYHGNWLVKVWKTWMRAYTSVTAFPPLDLVLRDRAGMEMRSRSRMALIVNNDYADLFGVIPKRATLDAGYFTIYVSTHKTRWGMFRSLIKWLLGRWKQDQELTVLHSTSVTINVRGKRRLPVMRDGEIDKLPLPFTVTLRPRALRVLAPAPPAAEAPAEAADEAMNAMSGAPREPDGIGR